MHKTDNRSEIKVLKIDQLRLKAPDNWINDPNGFIYYKGLYHLFYQYFPYEPRWGTMHWGHAVSEDLVTWKHLGIALYPTKKGDQNGCFSGSAVEHDGSLFLLYTGVRYLTVNPDDIHVCLNSDFEACQMLITSKDGFTFDNQNDKQVAVPVLEDLIIGHRTETRDPKVWRGNNAWYMILCTLDADGKGKNLIYKSTDLYHWELKNTCAHKTITGHMGECPDYFEVNEKGVLCYSVFDYILDGKREANQLLIMQAAFDEDRGTLSVNGEHRLLDYGMDLYAAQSAIDEAGRRIQISWLRMPVPTKEGWIGQMSTPRVITVQNGHIYTDVHPNIRKQFIIERKQSETEGLLAIYGACRITASMQEGTKLDIFGYQLTYEHDILITDRSAVFPHTDRELWRMQHKTPVLGGRCEVEIYAEDYMIEVYVNRGQYVITNSVYELQEDIHGGNAENLHVFTIE